VLSVLGLMAMSIGGCAASGAGSQPPYYHTSFVNLTGAGVIVYAFDEDAERRPPAASFAHRLPPTLRPTSGVEYVRPARLFDAPVARELAPQRREDFIPRLPDDATIYWQRAQLSDCERVERKRVSADLAALLPLSEGEPLAGKSGCSWQPTGPIRSQRIDLARIRSSDAYARATGAGMSDAPETKRMGYTMGLTVTFVFVDEGVEMFMEAGPVAQISD